MIFLTSHFENSSIFDSNTISIGLGFIIIILWIVKDFIPSLKSIVVYNIHYMPLTSWDKFLLWFIGSEISFLNIFTVFSLCLLCISPMFGLIDVSSLFLYLTIGIMISFLVRLNLTYIYHGFIIYRVILLLLLLAFLSVNILLFFFKGDANSMLFVSLTFFASFFLLTLQYFKATGEEQFTSHFSSPERIAVFGTSYRKHLLALRVSPMLQKAMGFGFFYKAIILAITYFYLTYKNSYVFDSKILFYLVFSPIIVFTYGFNNFFAFNTNYHLNFILRTNTSKAFVKDFFFNSLFFVSIDGMISLFFLYICKFSFTEAIDLFIFYFAFLIFLLSSGLLGSLRFSVKINNASIMNNLKMYTNPGIGIVQIGIMLLLVFYPNVFTFTLVFISSTAMLLLYRLRFAELLSNYKVIQY